MILKVPEDEVPTLYNPDIRKSHTPVNQKQGGNVLSTRKFSKANAEVSTRGTVKEPHTGGGSIQNV